MLGAERDRGLDGCLAQQTRHNWHAASLHGELTWGFIVALQTYEGGLGGEPGTEAHGGYTFCGLAALMLVGRASVLDLPSLLHWAVHRQVSPGPKRAYPAEICIICLGPRRPVSLSYSAFGLPTLVLGRCMSANF